MNWKRIRRTAAYTVLILLGIALFVAMMVAASGHAGS